MTNQLKLLLTEEELHNLKKCSIDLKNYTELQLKPLRDTLAGEARRIISLHKKVDLILKESDRLLNEINLCLGKNG